MGTVEINFLRSIIQRSLTMPRFVVRVAEVHNAYFKVVAKNRESAIDCVRDGGGDLMYAEYSYTKDSDTWDAEQEN